MIAGIRGILLSVGPESVVVEAGGLAYEVFLPARAIGGLPAVGAEIRLRTYLHVREDALVLFGFRDARDREVFLLLLGVTGVGPKLALALLSSFDTPDLLAALAARDTATLVRTPGVGRKLAERLGVDLSDKAAALGRTLGGGPAGTAPTPLSASAEAALLALGVPPSAARQAVAAALAEAGPEAGGLEALVKAALRRI